jgi:hypothetical protein
MRLSALLGRKAEAFAYYGQLEKTLLDECCEVFMPTIP